MPHEDRTTTPAVPRAGLSTSVLVAVFVGGALGTLARYALDTAHPTAAGHFPATLLLINLSGSLAIGMAVPIADLVTPRLALARPFVVVGLLGGWTTYSTLAVGAVLLGKDGHLGLGAAYLAATVLGGVALVALGSGLVRKVVPL
ncbi:MAG: fluoride efflux transporter FluC [Acidimicrobiales bacterium]